MKPSITGVSILSLFLSSDEGILFRHEFKTSFYIIPK